MKKLMVAAIAAFTLVSYAKDEAGIENQTEKNVTDEVSAESVKADDPVQDPLDEFVSGLGPVDYVAGTNVTIVRSFAFAENRLIRSVALDSITKAGRGLFQGCFSLETVSMVNLTDAASLAGAFNGCPSLKNVDLSALEYSKGLVGFPWQATSNSVVFKFKNGRYDRYGHRVD